MPVARALAHSSALPGPSPWPARDFLIGVAEVPASRQYLLMSQPIGDSDQLDLVHLAANLVLGDGFRADAAVTKAVDLVAKGVEGEATVALAMQPADPRRLDGIEVQALFRAMLEEHGLELVAPAEAGWVKARWIAELMLAGAIEPAAGANQLWQLWGACGSPDDELTWMLQLHDAWESSVGNARLEIEREMLSIAPTVIEGADRRLHDH